MVLINIIANDIMYRRYFLYVFIHKGFFNKNNFDFQRKMDFYEINAWLFILT